MQVVMEAAPLSTDRRILQEKTGTFKGMRRRAQPDRLDEEEG